MSTATTNGATKASMNEANERDPFNNNSSQITEVTNSASPQIVWQMTISGSYAYRGYRIPSLYPGVTWKQ